MWISSDFHFGHANVIKYSNRPFTSVAEMDLEIINRWNSLVKPNQRAYILGDLSFYKEKEKTALRINRLQGDKILIRGNHDRLSDHEYLEMGFREVHYYLEVKFNKRKYILCHYPFLTWNGAHRGSIALCGHSHGSMNEVHAQTTRLDVGVDNFNYYPVSFEEIERIMKNRTYRPVDHHGTK